jgi:hypothetical protein
MLSPKVRLTARALSRGVPDVLSYAVRCTERVETVRAESVVPQALARRRPPRRQRLPIAERTNEAVEAEEAIEELWGPKLNRLHAHYPTEGFITEAKMEPT